VNIVNISKINVTPNWRISRPLSYKKNNMSKESNEKSGKKLASKNLKEKRSDKAAKRLDKKNQQTE
jgi:hypothetical protein